jgi:hypothetical protein
MNFKNQIKVFKKQNAQSKNSVYHRPKFINVKKRRKDCRKNNKKRNLLTYKCNHQERKDSS